MSCSFITLILIAVQDDLGGLQEDDGVDGGVEVGGVAVADNQDLGLASLFRQRTVSMEDQEDTAFLDHLPLGDPDDEVGTSGKFKEPDDSCWSLAFCVCPKQIEFDDRASSSYSAALIVVRWLIL